jgi:peptidoglycan/xylan/chitin deacetylase (PgdA/CDA1 family)
LNFLYSPPVLVKKLFGNFIWQTSNNKILLSFDDGPTETVTLKILTVLSKNKIKAIFFCVGNNINKYPDLTKIILAEGHTIANHTMSHKLITKMSWEEAANEISTFNNLIKEKFNYEVRYFRPPHGRFNLKTNSIIRNLNLKGVMWNLLTYDFENDYKKVQHSIDNYLAANSLIVFHDNIKCSSIIEDSLKYTIDKAVENGYTFGEPEDCLK